MCTVTFIPSKEGIYLTSNRDEKHWRSAAIGPEAYAFTTGRIIFPKDGDAGGSWIAIHENGNAVVFLNGGFVFHQSKPPYRKSRGLVLIDLINHESPLASFHEIALEGIEPFTAVIWQAYELHECRWDGKDKYAKQAAADQPHIWSSATLYDEEVASKRKKWFEQWIVSHPFPSQNEIIHFHQFTGDGDARNDLMMNRDGKVFTVSVTSAFIGTQQIMMQYLDVKKSARLEKRFNIVHPILKG